MVCEICGETDIFSELEGNVCVNCGHTNVSSSLELTYNDFSSYSRLRKSSNLREARMVGVINQIYKQIKIGNEKTVIELTKQYISNYKTLKYSPRLLRPIVGAVCYIVGRNEKIPVTIGDISGPLQMNEINLRKHVQLLMKILHTNFFNENNFHKLVENYLNRLVDFICDSKQQMVSQNNDIGIFSKSASCNRLPFCGNLATEEESDLSELFDLLNPSEVHVANSIHPRSINMSYGAVTQGLEYSQKPSSKMHPKHSIKEIANDDCRQQIGSEDSISNVNVEQHVSDDSHLPTPAIEICDEDSVSNRGSQNLESQTDVTNNAYDSIEVSSNCCVRFMGSAKEFKCRESLVRGISSQIVDTTKLDVNKDDVAFANISRRLPLGLKLSGLKEDVINNGKFIADLLIHKGWVFTDGYQIGKSLKITITAILGLSLSSMNICIGRQVVADGLGVPLSSLYNKEVEIMNVVFNILEMKEVFLRTGIRPPRDISRNKYMKKAVLQILFKHKKDIEDILKIASNEQQKAEATTDESCAESHGRKRCESTNQYVKPLKLAKKKNDEVAFIGDLLEL